MRFTLGTHNTLDGRARPTTFADLILFTEANVTGLDRLRFRAAGYGLLVCREQPDLAVGWRRDLFKREGEISYHRIVTGVPEVTPNRGTAWLPLVHRPTLVPVAAVWEHRINAAFPPYVRGEGTFRRRAWRDHTNYTLDLIDRLAGSRYLCLAGGDVNTPERVPGYWPNVERGERLDRLALGLDDVEAWQLGDAQYLSTAGSDHPRLVVEVVRARSPGQIERPRPIRDRSKGGVSPRSDST